MNQKQEQHNDNAIAEGSTAVTTTQNSLAIIVHAPTLAFRVPLLDPLPKANDSSLP